MSASSRSSVASHPEDELDCELEDEARSSIWKQNRVPLTIQQVPKTTNTKNGLKFSENSCERTVVLHDMNKENF